MDSGDQNTLESTAREIKRLKRGDLGHLNNQLLISISISVLFSSSSELCNSWLKRVSSSIPSSFTSVQILSFLILSSWIERGSSTLSSSLISSLILLLSISSSFISPLISSILIFSPQSTKVFSLKDEPLFFSLLSL